SDDAQTAGGATGPTPGGRVQPNVRGRLRKRLPGRIRTARGQLFVLAAYLLLSPFIIGILAISGGLAKMNLAPQDVAAATLGTVAVGGLRIITYTLRPRRSVVA